MEMRELSQQPDNNAVNDQSLTADEAKKASENVVKSDAQPADDFETVGAQKIDPEKAAEAEMTQGERELAQVAAEAPAELDAAKEAEVAPDEVIVEAEDAEAAAMASPEVKAAEAAAAVAAEARGEAEDTLEGALEQEVSEDAQTRADRVAMPTDKDGLLAMATEILERPGAEIRRDEVTRLRKHYTELQAVEAAKARIEHEKADAEAGVVTVFEAEADPRDQKFAEVMEAIKDKRTKYAEALEAERNDNLARKSELVNKIMTLAADTDNVNRTYADFKELRDAFLAIGEVPATAETDLQRKFKDAQERYYDQLKINKDLRDYDFLKNLEAKQLLISEAEKLVDEADVIAAFRRLQDLHVKWRETGPVAKEQREEVWNKFKDISAEVNKRYQAFFEERKAREAENEAGKTALCERVEALDWSALKSFAQWDAMTQEVLAAQEEWKKWGFASRRANNILFARFRETCDRFFTAKAEYFRSVKDTLNQNLAQKVAMCEKAEALKDSTDWQATTEQMVTLQKEWKTVGPAPKKQSDAVWRRFQAACDYFFDQKKAYYAQKNAAQAGTRQTEQANLKAKQDIIDELRAIDPAATANDAEAREAVKSRLIELQSLWGSIGHVPFREKDKVKEAYRAVVDELYNAFEMTREHRRMAAFEANLAGLQGDQAKLYRERDHLMRVLEAKRGEAQTIANNMGFFTSKTKNGEKMVRDFERKLDTLKADIADLEKKIAVIDSKL